jgi:hypothetical protein
MHRRLGTCIVAAAYFLALAVPPAEAGLSNETLGSFVRRVGARVDSTKGNLFVTTFPVERGRVEIRLVNDASRERLGFYAYGFGNAKEAKDPKALYEYMLRANSDLAIGSFFVDKDDDIGYKFFLSTREPMNFLTFETVYVAMANVIKERGPEIVRLTTPEAPAEEAEKTRDTPRDERARRDAGRIGR